MSSSLYPQRRQTSDDTQSARTVAAQKLRKGDRVCHRVTGKFGSFVEINTGFALPEVWVQFDSETDILVPTSCNPLDLELVAPDCDKSASAITPQIVEELTEAEQCDRHRLELRVEQAFYEAGKALAQLRERRLYRNTHKTFEAYCRERFGFTRQAANYLIAGADIFKNLTTIGCQTLPTSERQVRSLFALEPEQQCQVWQQAVEASNGKVPSGRIVKGIVSQLKEKPLHLATDFCTVGDVFTLTKLEGEERLYNRCPCVVVDVNDFTIKVDVYNATIIVKPENLNWIDSPDTVRQFPAILKRIKRLWQCDLDRGAVSVLSALGRQTYLTHLEAKLLVFLEREYGIDIEF